MDRQTLTRIIREIGRGRNAARDLPREDARALFAAMLAGEIPDLQLGAALIALRIKGESLEELAAFLEAGEASYAHLAASANTVPLVIPAYNGARQLPNLTPLLAQLLANTGVTVLVHGVTRDAGRVTTHEVFAAMGIPSARSVEEAQQQLATRRLAFIPIDVLAPPLARLLVLRAEIGLRGPAHTVVKMLQPFASRAVRLVSVTHPDYAKRMREFFITHAGGALILRGAEGEAVAHPRREPLIDWADGKTSESWSAPAQADPELPPDRDAAVTAQWISETLGGQHPVPTAIAHQVQCCLRTVNEIQKSE